jgi:hypothetical protein
MMVHSFRKRKVKPKKQRKRSAMPDEAPLLEYLYLTLPEQTTPILNIFMAGVHARFKVTREQLFELNEQIADVLVRRSISSKHSAGAQLVLNLEKAAGR